jgi:hypothetical protein
LEPQGSYIEGDDLARYAAFHYEYAGVFLLRLHAMRHDDLSFAKMELATAVLRDILQQYTLEMPSEDLEKRIIYAVDSRKEIRDDSSYQELKGIENAIVSSLTLQLGLLNLIKKGALNKAMSSTGGIDLTSNKFLQTLNGGKDIKFHLDPAMLAQLQNAPGLTVGRITVQTIKSIPEFLGIDTVNPK